MIVPLFITPPPQQYVAALRYNSMPEYFYATVMSLLPMQVISTLL